MPEPSQRMSIGRLPLTARSSSSNLETPRTGGGFTARSSGERGTPRDAQRLALGERPSRESIQQRHPEIPRLAWGTDAGAPILSPRHTARSAALSSEPRSRTPSSEGDSLSSTSRFEHSARLDSLSYCCAAEEVAGTSSRSNHLDLQRSLELIRFVIQRENQKLKDLVQQTREGLFAVEKGFANVLCQHELCDHLKASQPGPRVLEWRLEHIGAEVKALCSPAGRRRRGERLEFKMSDCPGLELALSFESTAPDRGPDNGLGDAAAKQGYSNSPRKAAEGCMLKLEVTCPWQSPTDVTTRLCLDVSVEQGKVVHEHRMDLLLIRGAGQASHPLTRHMADLLASGGVLCRVETKTAPCLAGPLNLHSEWCSSA